jgi:hypothetical protein
MDICPFSEKYQKSTLNSQVFPIMLYVSIFRDATRAFSRFLNLFADNSKTVSLKFKIYLFVSVEVFLKRCIIRACNVAWLQQKLQHKKNESQGKLTLTIRAKSNKLKPTILIKPIFLVMQSNQNILNQTIPNNADQTTKPNNYP